MTSAMLAPAAAPDFLARAGWAGAQIVPLAGDASFRRYFRVLGAAGNAVLMDAPPPHEDPRPFVAIAQHLTGLGFAAPAILAHDLDAGLVLLEDFGDVRMREAIDAGDVDEMATYAQAVALLADLHRHPPAMLPSYSTAVMQRETSLFVEWYCPAAGLDVDLDGYAIAWDAAFARIAADAPVTVLRDYHSENIMLRDCDGDNRLGLLDFQDALIGHPAYDLVSLLQDARRDVPEAVEAAMLTEYRGLANPGPGFVTSYAVLGAQRNAKILGIFARLSRRDGKPRYLDFMPRVWRYLEHDLAEPALAEVADWFAANIPAARRSDWLARAQ